MGMYDNCGMTETCKRVALPAEWVRIPLQVTGKLICSMRRRCLAVLAANGGHTRY